MVIKFKNQILNFSSIDSAFNFLTKEMICNVCKIANRYRSKLTECINLVDIGNEGIYEAILNYDVKYNVNFESYAQRYIENQIKKESYELMPTVLSSSDINNLKAIRKIQNSFYQDYGRYPSSDEIEKITNGKINSKKVDDILLLSNVRSFDCRVSLNGDGSDDDLTLIETIGECDNYDYVDDCLMNDMYSLLTDDEYKVVSMLCGQNGYYSHRIEEIAKEMDISVLRVQKLIKSAQVRINKIYFRKNGITYKK